MSKEAGVLSQSLPVVAAIIGQSLQIMSVSTMAAPYTYQYDWYLCQQISNPYLLKHISNLSPSHQGRRSCSQVEEEVELAQTHERSEKLWF